MTQTLAAFLLLLASACALIAPLPAAAELPAPGEEGAVADPRYCGEPARTEEGVIKRSRAVLRAFAKVFPCPATLEPVPSCQGWAIDHTIPLAVGGCDSIANLTWLPDPIKSCAGSACKDRWERKYHAHPRQKVLAEKVPPAEAVEGVQ